MKQWTKNISLIFLSTVIFLTGMGTTLVNFCCPGCADEFLAIYTPIENEPAREEKTSCCQEAQEEEKEASCVPDQQHEEESCCKIERQSTDLYTYHSSTFIIKPYTWIANNVLKVSNTVFFQTAFTNSSALIKAPPDVFTPRTYLAFIRILII